MAKQYKVALIGCGARSSMHINAYQFLDRGQVVACCDIDREKADERAEEFVAGDLTVVGSLAGGGDLGAVDLIYIPEPATVVLISIGLAGFMLTRRR